MKIKQSHNLKSYIKLFFTLCILFVYTNNIHSIYATSPMKQDYIDNDIVEWVYGKGKAEVIIYISMNCYACKMLYNDILPQLKNDYVKNNKITLKIRFIATEATSFQAEILSYCLSSNKYQKTKKARQKDHALNILVQSSQQWYQKSNNISIFKDILKNNDYSTAEIESCLNDKEMEHKILQSRLYAAKNLSIVATPTIIINNKTFRGLQKYDWFKENIDKAIYS